MSDAADQVMSELLSRANPKNVAGFARFGISPEKAIGVSVTELRKVAKRLGKDHSLALELWSTGVHEARTLAAMIDDPAAVTKEQMEEWVNEFNSWDICDQATTGLFDRTPYGFEKAVEWSRRDEEFVKRAGFAMMAGLAVHDKAAPDRRFMDLFQHVRRESVDNRRYVKKAVNWALRQIGKRNVVLNREAVRVASEMMEMDSRSARWIASDALRELRSEAVLKRLRSKRTGARPGRCP